MRPIALSRATSRGLQICRRAQLDAGARLAHRTGHHRACSRGCDVPQTVPRGRSGSVNRRRILTPHRHPKLTPRSCSVLSLVPVVHRSSARAAKCPSRRLTQRRACWACGPTGARGCDRSDNQERCLSRQLSFPVSRISQWWVSRSSNAVAILASPKTVGHSAKARLVVITTDVRS